MSSAALAIRAHDLTRTFGAFTAVDHITFDVKPGEVFGFLGANGAGKTTAIRMLTGLLAPTGGEASVAGHDVATESEAIKRDIGYMSQRFSLYDDLTVRENIRLYGGIYDLTPSELKERTQRILDRLGLARAERDARAVDSARLEAEARVLRRAAARAEGRVPRRADERRRSDDAAPVLGADLRGGARRHDRARHDALHGRSRVLRPDLDHGVGADRGDGRAVRAQAARRRRVDRRAVRAAGAAERRVLAGRRRERAAGDCCARRRTTSCATGARSRS